MEGIVTLLVLEDCIVCYCSIVVTCYCVVIPLLMVLLLVTLTGVVVDWWWLLLCCCVIVVRYCWWPWWWLLQWFIVGDYLVAGDCWHCDTICWVLIVIDYDIHCYIVGIHLLLLIALLLLLRWCLMMVAIVRYCWNSNCWHCCCVDRVVACSCCSLMVGIIVVVLLGYWCWCYCCCVTICCIPSVVGDVICCGVVIYCYGYDIDTLLD